MNFISDCLVASDEFETPRSFIYWSAMAALSAVGAPNVWMNKKGAYQLRPNLFVMLMARPGLGKGFPVNMAKKLVMRTHSTRIINGQSSIEGIIRDLSTQSTNEDNSPPITDSRGFYVSSEFAASLVKNELALKILTDLYDCHWNEDWSKTLKGTKDTNTKERLINPNLTLLSGANEAQFFAAIPQAEIEGGLVGRMLLIHEDRRYRTNALMSDVIGEESEKDIVFPFDTLAEHLKLVAQANGKFQWTSEASRIYIPWYNKLRSMEVTDKTGQQDRLNDHVCKVAMNLSLAESVDLVIRSPHIEEAIEKCQMILFTTKRVTFGKGKDPLSDQLKLIFSYIIQAGEAGIFRQKLLAKGAGDYDATMVDKVLDQLMQIGWVEKERSRTDRSGRYEFDDRYYLSESGKAVYQQKVKEVNHD